SNLHSLDDYVNVLMSISKIESISRYLVNNIIPVSADWPDVEYSRAPNDSGRVRSVVQPDPTRTFKQLTQPDPLGQRVTD
ncbi:869_t:CDS:2, partial [Entrophospora sp. SA101]